MRTITVLSLLTGLFLAGCGTMRGLPSHGGGKRFDEEQRAVSSAVRRTIAQMKLDELQGRSVRLIVENIAHSGGGSIQWPGPESMSVNVGQSRNGNSSEVNNGITTNSGSGNSVGGNLNYRLSPGYFPSAFGTDSDVAYLRAVVLLRLAHQGLRIATERGDATLVVLVDVIGTDLSRTDWLLWRHDDLSASVELTYYAVRTDDQHLLIPARRCGARAAYRLTGSILLSGLERERNLTPLPSTDLAVETWPVLPAEVPVVPPPREAR